MAVGCSVDLFLFNNAYIDIATLSQVMYHTAGVLDPDWQWVRIILGSWIRTRIRVETGVRIRTRVEAGSGSALECKLDLYPDRSQNSGDLEAQNENKEGREDSI